MAKTIVVEERTSFKELVRLILGWLRKWQAGTAANQALPEKADLILRAALQDYQIYISRMAERFQNKPVLCYESASSAAAPTEIAVGVYLGQRADLLTEADITGRIEAESHTENFSIHLDKPFFNFLNRPSYWIDITVPIPEKVGGLGFKVFIDDITVHKKKVNRAFVSSIHRQLSVPPKPSLVLVLSLDGISAADVYGKNLPGFDAVAHDSVVFNNAICSASVTGSAAGCLSTGLGMSRHFLYDYDEWHFSSQLKTISPKITTIGELMRDRGYRTYGLTFFSKWRPQYGHSRGFDEFINVSSGAVHLFPQLQQGFRYMGSARSEPTFVMLHLPGAHPPLAPAVSAADSDTQRSSYQATLREVDSNLQAIIGWMKQQNLYNEALICLVADHGRSTHPYRRHGYQFEDDRLRVPMMIKLPSTSTTLERWRNRQNEYISATTGLYEIIAEATGAKLPDYYADLAERRYTDIFWANETMDYKTLKRIGLVGYEGSKKWEVYFSCNPATYEIGEAEDKNLDARVVSSARAYLSKGLDFVKKYPPQAQGEIRTNLTI